MKPRKVRKIHQNQEVIQKFKLRHALLKYQSTFSALRLCHLRIKTWRMCWIRWQRHRLISTPFLNSATNNTPASWLRIRELSAFLILHSQQKWFKTWPKSNHRLLSRKNQKNLWLKIEKKDCGGAKPWVSDSEGPNRRCPYSEIWSHWTRLMNRQTK